MRSDSDMLTKPLRTAITRERIQQHAADIDQLLQTVGTKLKVSRACINIPEKDSMVCVREWLAPNVKPSVESGFPLKYLGLLVGDDPVLVSEYSASISVPWFVRPLVRPLIYSLARAFDLDAIILAPHRVNGEIGMLLTLDICKEQTITPERLGSLSTTAKEDARQTLANIADLLRA